MTPAAEAGRGAPARGRTLAFDFFGTLVDPASGATVLDGLPGGGEALAARWRVHQLEISWLLSLMERYEDFEAVTEYALEVTLDEAGIDMDSSARRKILSKAYSFDAYADVPAALEALRAAGHEIAVFSNGSPSMLDALLRNSGLAGSFESVISVDDVRAFKPVPAVYEYAARRLGVPLGELWLVSGNPSDCAGAKSAGMRVAKVRRGPSFDYPYVDAPDVVVTSLAELPAALAQHELGAETAIEGGAP